MRAHIRKETKLVFQKINAQMKQSDNTVNFPKNIDLRTNERGARSNQYSAKKQLVYNNN